MAKKDTRKARSKKASRSKRKQTTRKQTSYRGGFEPAPVTWKTEVPTTLNLTQGQQFQELNKLYHGGAFYGGPYPGSVTNSGLPGDLVASAHLSPLNKAFADVAGLKDQVGGKRGRKGSRKGSRKGRKGSRKNRKGSRKYRGGALTMAPLSMSDFNKMLLPAGLEGRAGLNPEWKLAEDPNAFAPY